MNTTRWITHRELAVVSNGIERWLRLHDVELNRIALAMGLLATAAVRSESCQRKDIASIGTTLVLGLTGWPRLIEVSLVDRPDERLRGGQVSVLSSLGLHCLGCTKGSTIELSKANLRLVDVRHGRAAKRSESRR